MSKEFNSNERMGVSKYTPIKEEILTKVLKLQIERTKLLKTKYPKMVFSFYDTTAGCGTFKLDGKVHNGSPLVVLKEIVKHKDIEFNVVFIEKDKVSYDRLKSTISNKYGNIDENHILLSILNGDSEKGLKKLDRKFHGYKQFGFIYSDANGIPPFSALATMSHSNKYLDILINNNSSALKRVRSRFSCHKLLHDSLLDIDKKVWIVREPVGKWQWSFIIGTNKLKYKSPDEHFHKFDVFNGKLFATSKLAFNAMKTISYTIKESSGLKMRADMCLSI